jgi:hypothetical protein
MSVGTNIHIKYFNNDHLVTHEVLTAPCDLYKALAYVVNDIQGSKDWSITLTPSFIEYFVEKD